MSWIPTPDARSYSWLGRLLLAVLGRKERPSESVRLWARAPRVFLPFLRTYRAVDRASSPIEPGLRSLLMVRVSQLNGCSFCIDLNGSRALERGVSHEKLLQLGQFAASPLYSERERAALAFAEAVTTTGASVSPALRQALRACFSEEAIVEMSALVAFQNMSSKFNAALDVPAEGWCDLPGSAHPRA